MQDSITITDLTKVTSENKLNGSSASELQAAFMPYFEKASEWRDKASGIKVTSLAQTDEMRRAREARLALRDIRINTEKTRKELKEDSLRTGKAIDGMANVIKFLIEPIEEYLEKQEKYGEMLRIHQQNEYRDMRTHEAGKYIHDFPQTVDLGVISDEEFAKYLHFAKAQFDAREAAAKQLERERIDREEREAAERAAMQAENERLRKEAAEREAAINAERAERERLQREFEAQVAEQRAEAERVRLEAEAKERAERERLQREQEEKEAAEKIPAQADHRADHFDQAIHTSHGDVHRIPGDMEPRHQKSARAFFPSHTPCTQTCRGSDGWKLPQS